MDRLKLEKSASADFGFLFSASACVINVDFNRLCHGMDFGVSSSSGFDPPGSPAAGLLHPGVTACHLAFRSLALLLYLFANFSPFSFVGLFVSVVLLLSVDFWAVKNVTGRIMVRRRRRRRRRKKVICMELLSLLTVCFFPPGGFAGRLEVVELHQRGGQVRVGLRGEERGLAAPAVAIRGQ